MQVTEIPDFPFQEVAQAVAFEAIFTYRQPRELMTRRYLLRKLWDIGLEHNSLTLPHTLDESFLRLNYKGV